MKVVGQAATGQRYGCAHVSDSCKSSGQQLIESLTYLGYFVQTIKEGLIRGTLRQLMTSTEQFYCSNKCFTELLLFIFSMNLIMLLY